MPRLREVAVYESPESRIKQIKIGIPLMLLWGAYASVNAFISGTIPLRTGGNLSRSDSPIEFWFIFLLLAGLTVLGTRLAFRYRESIWGDWESNRRWVLEYLGLFCFLAAVYAIYISMHFKVATGSADQAQIDAMPWFMLKLCLLSAVPFGVLAYADKAWHSDDAAPISAGAWVAVCVAFSSQCPVCAFGLVFPFFPFVLSALLAHGIGTLLSNQKPAI